MIKHAIGDLLSTAIKAAINAGGEMMKVYKTDFRIEMKKNQTPITEADRRSNKIIFDHLNKYKIPAISEEDREWSYDERKDWDYFWLIDPLDGTKEFVGGNGEFTVNIALIKKDTPVLGVIYAPVPDVLYFAAENIGSYKKTEGHTVPPDILLDDLVKESQVLPCTRNNEVLQVVASRSHMTAETEKFIDDLKKKHSKTEIVSRGSSLKLCLVAEGRADIYPRLGTTMEWDIAAGHAIIRYAGGKIIIAGTDAELKYNKPDLRNPYFVASLS
jgi:3'(2'), 5'-bisphosphate nucleotidase